MRGRNLSSGSFKRYGATRTACRSGHNTNRRRSSGGSCCCSKGCCSCFGTRTCTESRRSSGTHCSTGRQCLYSHNRGSKRATFYTASTAYLGASYSRSWATHTGALTWSRSRCLTWTRPSGRSRPYGRSAHSCRSAPASGKAWSKKHGSAQSRNGGATSCHDEADFKGQTRHCGTAWRCR